MLFQSGLLDSLIYLLLGFSIGKKSRVGAILFLIISLTVLGSTLGATIGLIEGGRNLYLSILLVWLAVRSIKATQAIYSGKFDVPSDTRVNAPMVANFLAKQSVHQREPMWIKLFSLLTMFTSMGIVGYVIFQVGKTLKQFVRPDMLYGSNLPISNGYSLISFASMLVAVPLGLMLANVIFWIIPPVRRSMNKAAEGVSVASFKEGMTGLARIAIITVPIIIIAIVAFAFEPWTPKS